MVYIMFYQFGEKLNKIELDNICDDCIVAGYVKCAELEQFYNRFGFSHSTVDSCKQANTHFRSGVEVYDDYTFTQLRITNSFDTGSKDDCVALYIKKNMLIVVEVDDHDGSSREKFLCALEKYSPQNITLQKLIYSFLDTLVGDDMKIIEDTGIIINKLEELVLKDKANENFNLQLLQLKKELHNIHNYYEQLVDISEALEDNENDIFDNEDLRYISNYTNKVIRMREDIRSLSSAVVHLQDAYSSFLELKLNHTMKVFTVITSIFFPLTVIVGWYGMNFQSMPEFTWKYGYLFVIVLSIFVVALLVIIVKKRKWI